MQLGGIQKVGKTLGFIVLLLGVLVASVFLGKNASNYLGARASSCPAQDPTVSQLGSNSAIISWETTDDSIGRVEYGTNIASLNLAAGESATGKIHTVPLTLLTPNTTYYYMIAIGNDKCDSSGQTCTENCVPFRFTTSPVAAPPTAVPPTEAVMIPTNTPAVTQPVSAGSSPAAQPSVSTLCKGVETNIGASSADVANWTKVSQYDIDANGVINGLDVIKCQKSGR